MKIDVAKLDIALAHREATQTCPFCTRREWTTDEAPAIVVPTDPDTGDPILSAGAPAAVLVCNQCGYIRMHSVDVLFAESRG